MNIEKDVCPTCGNFTDRSDYAELIMAVSAKYPNETRHQTALRYIRDRDNEFSACVKAVKEAGQNK